MISKNMEKSRNEVRQMLFHVVHKEYNQKMARYYSEKLEAEIFSHYYYSSDEYNLRAEKFSKALDQLLGMHGSADSLMITSLDYNLIEEHAKSSNNSFLEINKNTIKSAMQSFSLAPGPSRVIQPELVHQFAAPRYTLEEDMEIFIPEDNENESFEFLETIAKIKEEEIKGLRDVLSTIQQENEALRSTLVQIRENLMVLESTAGGSHQEPNT